ncbi:histidine phosphatase family protein [Pediococcus stilesii]|uniref:Histidine phosphatase family protein n=1 Tax=Pediococcus stilesii TaxID=331679 RepID=A0A5R9BZ65_9LACO|nr:histidine phosphatase family protein [Pediococcus stilesii]TLQ05653.1 histidine phosphatase family protein [Pediococcus stilesii]
MKTVNYYFVRHGQTLFNRYRHLQGWSDSPLTEKGVNDAKTAGKILSNLNFANIYSSDTTRAIKTARYINAENQHPLEIEKMQPIAAFREQFFGYFEGANSVETEFKLYQQHSTIEPTLNAMTAMHGIKAAIDVWKNVDPFHDAESYDEITTRLKQGLDYTFDQAQDGDDVLIVSHGTLIRVLTSMYNDQIDVSRSPKNGSITKLQLDDHAGQILYFGKTS